jgi:repressor of nif and glnA expression
MSSDHKKNRKRLAILEILRSASAPTSSGKIAAALQDAGQDISERTVRLYLQQLDQEGQTECVGRLGRRITPQGLEELGASNLLQRVGYMSARIDQMSYQMDFDLATRSGNVVVNMTLVSAETLRSRLPQIVEVFRQGYAMGTRVALLKPGEHLGEFTIPDGLLGFCTVCSVTLNGVLLKHGIPVRSLFCGLLELHEGQAVRFAELINYDGCSIDPLEMFIRSGMTDYVGAISTGNGRIGAGFREVPAESYDAVVSLAAQLDRIGLGAFLKVGGAGQTLFNIPVRAGCSGAVVIGGLNPVAILEETGIRVSSRALAGMMPFHQLFHYSQLGEMLSGV